MNAAKTALAPLPKFLGVCFATEDEAKAYCKRFGAHPLVEQTADGWTAIHFASQALAREYIGKHEIVNGYAMGLRTGSVTRWAIGVGLAGQSDHIAEYKARNSGFTANITGTPLASAALAAGVVKPVPVASGDGKRMAGATTLCKQLATERPETLATKDTFIAAAAELGVIAATAGTQWYRLRTK